MKSPCFQFYTKEFLSSTFVKRLEPDELAVYMYLWPVQWEDDGLPDSVDELSDLFPKIKRARFEKIWKKISVKFPLHQDGKRRNTRLEEEREKQRYRSEQQRENGKKGGRGHKSHGLANVKPNETHSKTRAHARPANANANANANSDASSGSEDLYGPATFAAAPPAGAELKAGVIYSMHVDKIWRDVLDVAPRTDALREAAAMCENVTAGRPWQQKLGYVESAIRAFAEICAESKHTPKIPLKSDAFVRHFELVQQKVIEMAKRPKITRTDIYAEGKDA